MTSIFRPVLRRPRLATTATIALAVALSACGKGNDQQMTTAVLPDLPATLPLDATPSTAWPAAPRVTALPAAAPIRTVRVARPDDYYGYADAAWDYQDVLGDAPPDYYFDYDGVDPWAWEGYDQSVVFLEPIDDGYRYYYYRPGADEPYFVRDPYYGYGYDDGRLAVVYDSYGGIVPYDDYGSRRDYAARYLSRGRGLFEASRRNDRRAVSAANWAARSAAISAARARWSAARSNQVAWNAYHARAASRQDNYWREEAVRRQSDARRFANWRNDSFRSPPPPRAIPATWAKADWARDQSRFLPARAERAHVADNQPQRPDNQRRGFLQPRPQAQVQTQPQQPQARFVPGDRSIPGAGPMRAVREPQRGQPQAGANQPGPRADRGDNRGRGFVPPADQPQTPGRMQRLQPAQPQAQPQRGPRFVQPRPQPQPQAQGRGNGRPDFGLRRDRPQPQVRFQPRPEPQRVVTPPPQRPNVGMRAQPQPQRPAFQPQRAPQVSRPQFQPRIPQAAPRPQPQPQRPSVQPQRAPQAAAPAPRNNGGGDRGGGNGGGRGNGRNRGG